MYLKLTLTSALMLTTMGCSAFDKDRDGNLEEAKADALADYNSAIPGSQADDPENDYLFLENDADVEAEEAVAEEGDIRSNLRELKRSLRQSIRAEIIECAGIDTTIFADLISKKDELRASGASKEEMREQIGEIKQNLRTSIGENKEKIQECREQSKVNENPSFAALMNLGESCGGRHSMLKDKLKKKDKKRFFKGGLGKPGKRGKRGKHGKRGDRFDISFDQELRDAKLESPECAAAIESAIALVGG